MKLYSKGGFIDSTDFICLDDMVYNDYMLGSNMDTCFVDFITSTSEFNGKPRLVMELRSKVTDSICITISSNSGMVDMWMGFVHNSTGYYGELTANGLAWATNGNNTATISDIASSKSAIAVGAYASKTSFRNIKGISQSYGGYVTKGNLVPFSSRGPASDNRVKPDITGLGLTLGSAVSSYDPGFQSGGGSYDNVVSAFTFPQFGRTYPFAMLMGTSMSSPAVAGIVALMLEANPRLNVQQVKDILSETAIKDNFTGSLPAGGNNNWGNGKANAYAAVKKAWQTNSVKDIAVKNISYELFPNPTAGKFTISYDATKAETASIEIYDLAGKKLNTIAWKLQQGSNSKGLKVDYLANGFYMVKLSTADGSGTVKLVIE